MISCPKCDKSFESESSMKAHFAAKSDDSHSGSIAKVTKDCKQCGNTDSIYPSRRKTDDTYSEEYFCSVDCRAFYYGNKKKVSVSRVCKGCGNKYKSIPSEKLKYCSFECRCNNHPTGEDNPNWNGGQSNTYYGKNWNKMRELCIERDFSKCRMCRISSSEHRDKTGVDLHVHHKIPFGQFDSPTKANELHNLITMCASCHKTTENKTMVNN